ncbi:hypothetical protein [Isoptericola sp. BMS4]|uniref:hypothetical protein n=1 Tax=Isoptericola sp. BMS4 TaxID=2527875 RepID=UPI001421AB9D|nr:hypothetical protein [Isoptericola sp. BMS4]
MIALLCALVGAAAASWARARRRWWVDLVALAVIAAAIAVVLLSGALDDFGARVTFLAIVMAGAFVRWPWGPRSSSSVSSRDVTPAQ